jgi:hypothetical protein
LAVIVLISAGAGCKSDSQPTAVAKKYERLMYNGDALPAYAMLSARDIRALTRDKFAARHSVGLARTSVDSSSQAQPDRGDTAVVFVYGQRPNVQSLFAELLSAAFSGGFDTSKARAQVRNGLATAPLITYVDTVVLLREAGAWRVWIAAAERELLDSLYRELTTANDERISLAARATRARVWLGASDKIPSALVPNDQRAAVEKVLRGASLVDSLGISGRIVERAFGFGMRGHPELDATITNASSRLVGELTFRIWRGGHDELFHAYNIAPKGTQRMHEYPNLSAGRIDSAVVIDVGFERITLIH